MNFCALCILILLQFLYIIRLSKGKENKDMIRKIKKTMRLAKMIMEFENVSFFRALKEAREEIKDYEEQIEFENEANR